MNPAIPPPNLLNLQSLPTRPSSVGLPALGAPTVSEPQTGETSNPFIELLKKTNQDQVNSDNAIQALVENKTDNIQQVVLAVTKAEMSFQLFMEVRNHLVDSYNELMRMQF